MALSMVDSAASAYLKMLYPDSTRVRELLYESAVGPIRVLRYMDVHADYLDACREVARATS